MYKKRPVLVKQLMHNYNGIFIVYILHLKYTNQTFWHIKSHLVLVQVLPESSPYDLRAIPQQSPDIKQFIVLYTDE